MEVLTAYRQRVGDLRRLVETLKASHEKLFDLRSESWREQVEGDPDRAERLDDLHAQIGALEAEIERMRGELGLPPGPSGPV